MAAARHGEGEVLLKRITRHNYYWLVIAGAALLIVIAMLFYQLNTNNTAPAARRLNDALWADYLSREWQPQTGRTISSAQGSITTSEAQAYTMLRAVWENDPQVFARTWQWTEANIQNHSNHLFAWEWGKQGNSYGVLTGNGGQNTASDADCDIAFALLMAGQRWHNNTYLSAAKQIIPAIWQQEVVPIANRWYLAADNLEKTAQTPYIIVNPSYFSPYEYRAFARVDRVHPWNSLASDVYTELTQIDQAKLGSGASDRLPPAWVSVNRYTGQIGPSPNLSQGTNFGFNAFRAVWRIALDWQWNKSPRARQALSGFSALDTFWKQSGSLRASYSHSGQAAVNYSSLALYGGTLGYFQYNNPSVAREIILSKLYGPLYDVKTGGLARPVDYYDNNWVWFGLALYDGQLTNWT